MSDELKKGDRVSWRSHGGQAIGRVLRKLTKPTKVGSHEAKASPEDPQYLVRSDKSGGEAAHKPSALKKLRR